MSAEPITNVNGIERRLDAIERKLDRIDESIRGNGTPGINVRLDRLEQSASRQRRVIWLIIGAMVTATTTTLIAWIRG